MFKEYNTEKRRNKKSKEYIKKESQPINIIEQISNITPTHSTEEIVIKKNTY